MGTQALSCPQCGANDAAPTGARTGTCPSCRTLLHLVPAGTPERLVLPVLGAAEATRSARAFLRGRRKRAFLAQAATLGAPQLLYLPFARIEGDLVGWIFGTKKAKDRDGKETMSDEERHVLTPHDETFPLFATGEVGVTRLPPLGGVPTGAWYEGKAAAGGEVVPITESVDALEEAARGAWVEKARVREELDTVTGERLDLLGERRTIVRYPVWRVPYQVAGREYAVVLDARDGAVAYGRAPGSDLSRALFFAALTPLGAWLLIAAAWTVLLAFRLAAESSDDLQGFLFTIGLGGALALGIGFLGVKSALAGYRALRYGAEVEEGYCVHRGAALFDLEDDHDQQVAAERAEVEADPRLRPRPV